MATAILTQLVMPYKHAKIVTLCARPRQEWMRWKMAARDCHGRQNQEQNCNKKKRRKVMAWRLSHVLQNLCNSFVVANARKETQKRRELNCHVIYLCIVVTAMHSFTWMLGLWGAEIRWMNFVNENSYSKRGTASSSSSLVFERLKVTAPLMNWHSFHLDLGSTMTSAKMLSQWIGIVNAGTRSIWRKNETFDSFFYVSNYIIEVFVILALNTSLVTVVSPWRDDI